jgi:hypothetical protein
MLFITTGQKHLRKLAIVASICELGLGSIIVGEGVREVQEQVLWYSVCELMERVVTDGTCLPRLGLV